MSEETFSYVQKIIPVIQDDDDMEIENILAWRTKESGETEYLIKYFHVCYQNSQWISQVDLKDYEGSEQLIIDFEKLQTKASKTEPYYNPAYNKIDRIVWKYDNMYLVKWQKLDYDQMTWEDKVDDEYIEDYKTRQGLIHPKMDQNITKMPNTEEIKTVESYTLNSNDLSVTQLMFFNNMINDFISKENRRYADDMCGNLFNSCIALIDYIYNKIGLVGPFLIVTSDDLIQKWYTNIKCLARLSVLCFHGSRNSIDLIEKLDFYGKGNELKFNILITTPELLNKYSDMISNINWNLGIFNSSPKVDLKVGHKIFFREKSINNLMDELLNISNMLVRYDVQQIVSSDEVIKAAHFRKRLKIVSQSQIPKENIPPLEISYIRCPLSNIQKQTLKSMIVSSANSVRKRTFKPLCKKLNRISDHPFLLFGQEYKLKGVDFIEASTKLSVFERILTEHMLQSHKILVISHFNTMLDLVEDLASMRGYTYDRVISPCGDYDNGENLILWNPLYCQLRMVFDLVDVVVIIDGQTDAFIHRVMESRTEKSRLNSIFILRSAECSEELLSKLFTNTLDESKCEPILRLALIHACIDEPNPDIDELIRNRSPETPVLRSLAILAEELQDKEFWSDFLTILSDQLGDVEVKTEEMKSEDAPQFSDVYWTPRERNQLVRTLLRFDWGRWDLFIQASGLMKDKQDIINTCRAVLQEMLKASTDQAYPVIKAMIRQTYDINEIPPRLFIDTVFGDKFFSERLAHFAPSNLKRLELLHFIKDFAEAENASLKLRHVRLQSIAPSEWWSYEQDLKLVLGIWKYGFDGFDHFAENPDPEYSNVICGIEQYKLIERALKLGETARRTMAQKEEVVFNHISTDSEDEDLDIEMEQEIGTFKFTRDEKTKIFRYLLNMGNDEDYEKITRSLELSKDVLQTKEYIEKYINRCETPEQYKIPPSTAIRVLKRVNTMKELRAVLAADPTYFDAFPHWRQMPEKWCGQIERKFLEELSTRGIECSEEILKLPEFACFGGEGEDKLPSFISNVQSLIKRIHMMKEYIDKKPPPIPGQIKPRKINKPKQTGIPLPIISPQLSSYYASMMQQQALANQQGQPGQQPPIDYNQLASQLQALQAHQAQSGQQALPIQPVQQTLPVQPILPTQQILQVQQIPQNIQEQPAQQPPVNKKKRISLSFKKSEGKGKVITPEQESTGDAQTSSTEEKNEDEAGSQKQEEEKSSNEEEESESSESEDSQESYGNRERKSRKPSQPRLKREDHKNIVVDKFPFKVTSTSTVENLGTIVYDRLGFHNQRYIYPAGFKTTRIFTSVKDVDQRVKWVNEIIDIGTDLPMFKCYMADDPSFVFEGNNPTAPWVKVLKLIKEKSPNVRGKSVSGPEAFLLANPIVVQMIQQLPNIEKCTQYVPKVYEKTVTFNPNSGDGSVSTTDDNPEKAEATTSDKPESIVSDESQDTKVTINRKYNKQDSTETPDSNPEEQSTQESPQPPKAQEEKKGKKRGRKSKNPPKEKTEKSEEAASSEKTDEEEKEQNPPVKPKKKPGRRRGKPKKPSSDLESEGENKKDINQ